MNRILAFIGLFLLAAPVEAAAAAHNVVVIVADDLGFQTGCYGNTAIKTPNIDRLAASGTRFTRAYCTTASCSASRSVLMTGLVNHATGHYGHEHGYNHFSTFDNVRSLPVMLAEHGYRTCSIGKYHLSPEPVYHFQEYRNEGVQGNRNAVRMAQNAKAFIAEDDSNPFFLYFCTSDPHRGGGPDRFSNLTNDGEPVDYPGVTPVVYDPDEVEVPAWLPDQPEVRAELAAYYQAVSRVDQGLGVLLDALEETGHSDDTLVMFLSDNGPPFPGAKTTLYAPGMNLPLIVRNPEQTRHGIATDAMVTWADITPTVLDYVGIAPADALAKRVAGRASPNEATDAVGRRARAGSEPTFHGRSFLSILDQEDPAGFDEVYASHTFHEITMYYPMRVIVSGRFKCILNLAHQLPYPFASDLYASPTWQGILERNDPMLGNRTVDSYLHRPRYELFDIEADPDEVRNLSDDPNYAGVLSELQAKLRSWQEKTGDPWIVKYTYE